MNDGNTSGERGEGEGGRVMVVVVGGRGGGGAGGINVVGSDFPLAFSVYALVTVGNIEEKVLFVVLLVQQSHGG